MTSFTPTCTEPGRWDPAPDAEAPATEILAYLQHCDLCEFHAMVNLEDDLSLDVLLRDACRDLVIDGVERPAGTPERKRVARMPWRRRPDRAPEAHTLHEGFRFERSLTQAIVAAFSIVVLWTSFTAYQLGRTPTPEAPVADVEAAVPFADVPLSGQFIADRKAGHLYVSRDLPDGDSGQPMQNGMLYEEGSLLPVAAPRQVGTVMRVTNPANGLWVEVKVVEQRFEKREIFLPSQATDSLGLGGAAYVFVEMIYTPPPAGLAP